MSNIQTNKKAVIIGAGIAGIASAIRLQLKGFEVNVYEKNSYPGGKLSVFQLGDYRFDAGPSLFTMPQFVEELFSLARKKTADYFEYVKHPTSCKYFWQDGTQLHAESDVQKFAEKVQETFQIEEAVIVKKLQKAAFINEEIGDLFLEQSLHQPSNFFNLKTLKSILNIGKFDLDKTLHQANQKDVKHPKMVQLFDRFATYNGSNPYKTPGIMGIIPHYEHNVGTFFPTKGMNSITTSLVQLAEDLGVKFQYNKIVKEIILDKSQKKCWELKPKTEKFWLMLFLAIWIFILLIINYCQIIQNL